MFWLSLLGTFPFLFVFISGFLGNILTLVAIPYVRRYYGAQFSVLLLNSIVLILHLSLVGLLKYTIDIPHCKCFLLFVLSLCSHKDGLKARIYLIHPIYSQHHYRQFLTSMADRCHTKFFLSMTLSLVLRPSKLDNIKNNNYLKSKKNNDKILQNF